MDGVSVWDDEKVLGMDNSGSCTITGMYLMSLNHVLRNS